MTGKRGKSKEREEGKGFWFFFDVCGNVEKKFGFWILDWVWGEGMRIPGIFATPVEESLFIHFVWKKRATCGEKCKGQTMTGRFEEANDS